ncbi:fimbria/pilus periplasmic chaperone [Xanthomonas sacchari]|uniref:fimbrial biogenesis chaperone n=1 Tax=Xanthomonas sacchari TaxID=56458 RepID=UPI0022582874|nr:fimbria/pilus periplasmic chaperone [Xanthomonas sacchari]MCW0393835.1 hypothetical protein [Xanthomonas sacchari]MCW0443615.1 hypothetical protein [Xanthomonas sacchari]UYK80513.1 fimbria/pilus periplasmic chaperone [Xanthomonas sacchari]
MPYAPADQPIAVSPAARTQTADAIAAVLRVEPTHVEMRPDERVCLVVLHNLGDVALHVQARIFRWNQRDGRDLLRSTAAVQVYPGVIRIEPYARSTMVLTRESVLRMREELTYRLVVDRLLDPVRSGDPDVAVFGQCVAVPVFVSLPDTTAKITWSAYRRGGRLWLEATNYGRRHARVEQAMFRAGAAPALTLPAPVYVLAGASVAFELPWSETTEGPLQVNYLDDGGERQERVHVLAR